MKNDEISLTTKKRLSAALKKIMRKKVLSKITITDITDECNLNRNTFYYHFNDVNELLKWTLEQEAINVVGSMDLLTNMEDAIEFLLKYIDSNKYVINCACDSLGREHLRQFFYTDVKSIVDANLNELEKISRIPMSFSERELLTMFFVEGSAGLLFQYATNPKKKPRAELAKITDHLFARFISYVTE